MEDDLSHKESLALIEEMIHKAKNAYHESGTSALLWGSTVMFCSAVSFANTWWRVDWLRQIWVLTVLAIIPQVIISVREAKGQRFKSHTADYQGGIWIAFGVAMFLGTFYANSVKVESASTLFLIFYGMPTFATGVGERFRPMVFGGVVCWVCAVVSIYVPLRLDMVLYFIAAFCAWFLPGLMLRRLFLREKARHV